jgi:hypothetical protein
MVAETSSTALIGMSDICAYVRRSEKTVLDLIRCESLPARKIGGIWESDRQLIDEWRRARIVAGERDEHLHTRAM